VLAPFSVEVRVDHQGHPVAGHDVVNVRTTLSQFDKPLARRNQDTTEEVRIREMVRLALPLGYGKT
jgi:hypothetical protein